MSLQIGQITETPGAPLVITSPLWSPVHCEMVVGAGLNAYLTGLTGGHAVVGTEQLTGSMQSISGQVYATVAGGGSLTIEASQDGVAIWDIVTTIALIGLNIPNVFGPIVLPCWNIKLRFWNPALINQGFVATFLMKGV